LARVSLLSTVLFRYRRRGLDIRASSLIAHGYVTTPFFFLHRLIGLAIVLAQFLLLASLLSIAIFIASCKSSLLSLYEPCESPLSSRDCSTTSFRFAIFDSINIQRNSRLASRTSPYTLAITVRSLYSACWTFYPKVLLSPQSVGKRFRSFVVVSADILLVSLDGIVTGTRLCGVRGAKKAHWRDSRLLRKCDNETFLVCPVYCLARRIRRNQGTFPLICTQCLRATERTPFIYFFFLAGLLGVYIELDHCGKFRRGGCDG
jgi:hypothetical protein